MSTEGYKNAQWYIVTTYGSHENIVAQNILKRVSSFKLEEYVFDAVSAEETYIEKTKNGKEKEKKRNLYKGYIFVHMIMTEEAWYMVRNTPGVTGICGSSGGGTKPSPVPKNEMDSVLKRIGRITMDMISDYVIGDTVRIINGPFSGSVGQIVSIDPDSKTFKIKFLFLGSETESDADFADIEKVEL